MNRRALLFFSWLFLFVSAVAAQAQNVVTPREVLGFEPAEDRKLADWSQITGYFKKLDASSARVELREIGQSTLKRPFVVAFISSEENLRNLAKIQENQRKLADPRRIADAAQRQRLIAETPAVVAITCSIHSTEVVAAQMSMELAYRLASDNSKATRQILDNVVLLLVPSVNPDGIDIVNHWYWKTLGTRYEGTSPPELYHHYTGHDNNRDWFMLTQVETQLLSKLFWQEWFPEIVYDVHQQGATGSRMCLPPFFDPHNPNIDPLIVRQTGTIGMRMATKLQAAGFKGVVTNSTYDMWWHGGLRSAPYYHNAVGILTEAASARLATPIEIKREQLRSQTRGLQNPLLTATNFPDAWEGGTWRMRDIADMELITTRTLLEEAALHKEELLNNFVKVAARAIEAGKNEAPYAYIVPAEQHDRASAERMVDILMQQGVEVHRAKSDFESDGRKYGAGSYVVLLAQPYRANVKCLFEAQKYPDRRVYPGGPAEAPYDVAGWTLPMQMGVNYAEAGRRFDAQLEKFDVEALGDLTHSDHKATRGKPYQFSISGKSLNSFVFINELYDAMEEAKQEAAASNQRLASIKVFRLSKDVNLSGRPLQAGAYVVEYTGHDAKLPKSRNSPRSTVKMKFEDTAVPGIMDIYGLALVYDLEMEQIFDDLKRPDVAAAVKPYLPARLALYKSATGSMDEGWTRWVLEEFKFDYKSALDADIRAGNLKEKFDVIILPDMNANQIVQGNRAGSYPEEFTGGITEAGVANLKTFVEAGGVLICFDSASEFAMTKFDLPVKNLLAGLASDQFYAPGSIFRAAIDTTSPIAYGMPQEADLYFTAGRRGMTAEEGAADAGQRPRAPQVRALAFEVTDPARARSVARYLEGNPLRSGWLLGPQFVAGKSALVDVTLGKGRVILFGFRPQHRGQTWGTFKLIFNSILLGGKPQ